jgi:4-hydroxy-tetrahydrodipicolinate synthase
MNETLISGVYAAILTPRTAQDHVNVEALQNEVEFLVSKGLSSFAVNGATGEFCITTPEQLQLILSTVHKASDGKAEMLCGIGAASSTLAIEFAAVAAKAGVKALLLPMPCFFPYQQEDLDAFCREVAANTSLPILLYNLPQFTSGLDKETVRRLIVEVPNIIGIKDSSGSLDILRDLTQHGVDARRIVGNDSALCPAMTEAVCDGVVSGVACVLPELILRTFEQYGATDSREFVECDSLLNEFIAQLGPFPTPWGLKWIAEARGVLPATFNLPLTTHRKTQAAALVDWFHQNESRLTAGLAIAQ